MAWCPTISQPPSPWCGVAGVDLDLDAVRVVLGGLVDQHMAARDQKQPAVAFKEEAAGVGQATVMLEGGNAGRRKQQGVDHVGFLAADRAHVRRQLADPF